MDKIKMTTPLVEMDGDEMTRIIWQDIKDVPTLHAPLQTHGSMRSKVLTRSSSLPSPVRSQAPITAPVLRQISIRKTTRT